VISCTARATVLKRTLADFEETDWAGPQPWVVIDASPDPDPLVRILETGHRALETALATHPDYVLFLEDDLEFNRFIGSNLAAWPPVARGELSFATLYTPGSRANQGYVIVPAEQTICLEPTSVWGGQAYLIAAHTTRHSLNAWNSAPAAGLNSDLRMPRLAGQFGLVLAHTPSLVNHAAVPSTWGGITHQALDFRRWWQSPRRPTHTSGNSHNSPTLAALATATDHTADAFWESCAAARVVTVALGQDAANWTPQTTLECVRRVAHEQSGKTSVLVIADATRVVCEPSLRSLQSRFASPDSPVVFGSNPGCGDTTCGPLPGGPYWIGKPEALAELANLSPPERESSPDQLAAVLTHRLQALGFTVEVDDNRRFGLRPRLG
jgi:hypothetical protein